jgi:hypothetical protein
MHYSVVSLHTRNMGLICMGIEGTENYRCITRIMLCTMLVFSSLPRIEETGGGCSTTMLVLKGGRGNQVVWSWVYWFIPPYLLHLDWHAGLIVSAVIMAYEVWTCDYRVNILVWLVNIRYSIKVKDKYIESCLKANYSWPGHSWSRGEQCKK